MSVRVQPAMAMRPDLEPPAASQRLAAVCQSRVGYGAGGDQSAQLGVGERFDQRRLDTRCLHAEERVGMEIATGGRPGGEAAYGLLSDASSAGCGAC